MEDGSGGGLGIFLFIYIAVIALFIASMWKTFTKAGEPGWAAIIPFYNTWVMCKISGAGALWFVLMFIPFVNIVALFIVAFGMARSFGKSTGFGAGLVFLPFIFYPILGFGDAEYVGPDGASAAVLPPTGGQPGAGGPFVPPGT